jgi:hypothetical protein
MSPTKRSIFRERAIQHYAQSRDQDVLPHFVSPPVFLFLWMIASLCLVLGLLAWHIRTPVYTAATGIIVGGSSSAETQAVLFVPADQQHVVHAGEPVQLQIGSSENRLLLTVASVTATPLSPERIRQHYHLDAGTSLLVTQPSVILVVTLDKYLSAASYGGSIVHAQVQVGEQSLLSFVTWSGSISGS